MSVVLSLIALQQHLQKCYTVVRHSAIALLLLGCMHNAGAQDRFSVGITGAYAANLHRADFRSFPGVPNCCPTFESGSGAGLSLALLGRLPLADALRAEFRVGYTGLSGLLLRRERTTVSGNQTGVFEHTVDASLAAITVEPVVAYNLIADLHGFVGAHAGIVTTSLFDQQEELVEPSTGTFPGGARIRNEVLGVDIPEAAALRLGVMAGLQWDLPMNTSKSLRLVPEVSYTLGLSSVVTPLSWNVDQLRIGASVVWTPEGQAEPVKPAEPVRRIREERRIDTASVAVAPSDTGFTMGVEEVTETIDESGTEVVVTRTIRRTDTLRVIRRSSITAAITASGVNADGSESPSFVIDVEEFASVLMNPLLGYVFFDEGQSTLPERYRRLTSSQTTSFAEENVNSYDKLPTYYDVLNIVGGRMRRLPNATIILVGCNADIGVEASNSKLSTARAEEVRRYLMDVWGVPGQRIRVQQRNLPEKAANTQTADGAQENRRVEIVAEDAAVMAPVITRDTARSITPPSVRLRPTVHADRPIARWDVVLRQGQTVLKTFAGTDAVPSVLDWNVQQEAGTHPRSDQPITYRMNVVDDDSNRTEATGVLDVKLLSINRKRTERLADREIDRFSLILFDVRSAELGASNTAIMDLIKPYVRPSSTVTLTGLTDRLGNAVQNQVLAEDRARSAARALGVANTGIIRGVGNATTYAPELPEGRLYTRTVDIVIETPIAP